MYRWISGFIIAAFVITCLLFLSKTWVLSIVVGLSCLTFYEYVQMTHKEAPLYQRMSGIVLCGLTTYLLLFCLKKPEEFLALFVFLLMISFLIHFRGHEDPTTRLKHVALFYTGILYIALSFTFIGAVRTLSSWEYWVFIMLAATFLNDTGAYLVGHWLGKHKLAPQLSPKKTVEGLFGGWVFSLIAGFLVHTFSGAYFIPYIHTFILSTLIALVGPLGDLSESLIKRGLGMKDSGNLIPGHGGILDRVDSLLFTAPVVYFYAVWIV